MIRIYAHYISFSTPLYIFFILYYVICVEYVTEFSTNKIKIFIFRFQMVQILLYIYNITLII